MTERNPVKEANIRGRINVSGLLWGQPGRPGLDFGQIAVTAGPVTRESLERRHEIMADTKVKETTLETQN